MITLNCANILRSIQESLQCVFYLCIYINYAPCNFYVSSVAMIHWSHPACCELQDSFPWCQFLGPSDCNVFPFLETILVTTELQKNRRKDYIKRARDWVEGLVILFIFSPEKNTISVCQPNSSALLRAQSLWESSEALNLQLQLS